MEHCPYKPRPSAWQQAYTAMLPYVIILLAIAVIIMGYINYCFYKSQIRNEQRFTQINKAMYLQTNEKEFRRFNGFYPRALSEDFENAIEYILIGAERAGGRSIIGQGRYDYD